jgi:hypothetical protein
MLACNMAVELAKEASVLKILVETDCKSMVNKLNSGDVDRSVHSHVIEDIKFRSSSCDARRMRLQIT